MRSKHAISLLSYPKINLALDILGRDESGYHIVQTVMHEVRGGLYDEVQIETRDDEKILLRCDNSEVPVGSESVMMRAVRYMQQLARREDAAAQIRGATIFLKKRIPIAAGLGGGSSNIAAILKGLAQLWGVEDCVFDFAREFGCDVPFFLFGGTALGEHYGEKITTLPPLPSSKGGALQFEIIDTGMQVKSEDAYARLDLKKCGSNTAMTEKMIAGLKSDDLRAVFENLHNDFEMALPGEIYGSQNPAEKILLAGSGGSKVRIRYL